MKKFLILIVLGVILFLPQLTLAQVCDPKSTEFCNPLGSESTLESLLVKLGGQLTILAIPVLAIIIIWGAFNIMTSEGNEEKYATGKKTIIYGIIGFVILALGSGIGYILKDALTSVN